MKDLSNCYGLVGILPDCAKVNMTDYSKWYHLRYLDRVCDISVCAYNYHLDNDR